MQLVKIDVVLKREGPDPEYVRMWHVVFFNNEAAGPSLRGVLYQALIINYDNRYANFEKEDRVGCRHLYESVTCPCTLIVVCAESDDSRVGIPQIIIKIRLSAEHWDEWGQISRTHQRSTVEWPSPFQTTNRIPKDATLQPKPTRPFLTRSCLHSSSLNHNIPEPIRVCQRVTSTVTNFSF